MAYPCYIAGIEVGVCAALQLMGIQIIINALMDYTCREGHYKAAV